MQACSLVPFLILNNTTKRQSVQQPLGVHFKLMSTLAALFVGAHCPPAFSEFGIVGLKRARFATVNMKDGRCGGHSAKARWLLQG